MLQLVARTSSEPMHTCSPVYSCVNALYCLCRECFKVDGEALNANHKGLLELEFLIRVCHQGSYVVDLCCGGGSGCIVGLKMGHDVVGLDLSAEQVAGALKRIRLFADMEVRRHFSLLHIFLPCTPKVNCVSLGFEL